MAKLQLRMATPANLAASRYFDLARDRSAAAAKVAAGCLIAVVFIWLSGLEGFVSEVRRNAKEFKEINLLLQANELESRVTAREIGIREDQINEISKKLFPEKTETANRAALLKVVRTNGTPEDIAADSTNLDKKLLVKELNENQKYIQTEKSRATNLTESLMKRREGIRSQETKQEKKVQFTLFGVSLSAPLMISASLCSLILLGGLVYLWSQQRSIDQCIEFGFQRLANGSGQTSATVIETVGKLPSWLALASVRRHADILQGDDAWKESVLGPAQAFQHWCILHLMLATVLLLQVRIAWLGLELGKFHGSARHDGATAAVVLLALAAELFLVFLFLRGQAGDRSPLGTKRWARWEPRKIALLLGVGALAYVVAAVCFPGGMMKLGRFFQFLAWPISIGIVLTMIVSAFVFSGWIGAGGFSSGPFYSRRRAAWTAGAGLVVLLVAFAVERIRHPDRRSRKRHKHHNSRPDWKEGVGFYRYTPFSSSEIKNLQALIDRLRTASDPGVLWIKSELSPTTREALESLGSSERALRKMLVADFQELCRGALFDLTQFGLGGIDARLAPLISEQHKPGSNTLVRLNRLLLAKAFPHQISPMKFPARICFEREMYAVRGRFKPKFPNKVFRYLINRMSYPVAEWIMQKDPGDLVRYSRFLAHDLQDITSGECIYEAERFKGITLRPKTRLALAINPLGGGRRWLNRLLLEDATVLDRPARPIRGANRYVLHYLDHKDWGKHGSPPSGPVEQLSFTDAAQLLVANPVRVPTADEEEAEDLSASVSPETPSKEKVRFKLVVNNRTTIEIRTKGDHEDQGTDAPPEQRPSSEAEGETEASQPSEMLESGVRRDARVVLDPRGPERAAMEILRRKPLTNEQIDLACRLLVEGIKQDLDRGGGVPNLRLYDLLAGLAYRYKRFNYVSQLHSLAKDYKFKSIPLTTRLEKWQKAHGIGSPWAVRWLDRDKPIKWGCHGDFVVF